MELANVKNTGQILTVTVARWHSGADGLALAVTLSACSTQTKPEIAQRTAAAELGRETE